MTKNLPAVPDETAPAIADDDLFTRLRSIVKRWDVVKSELRAAVGELFYEAAVSMNRAGYRALMAEAVESFEWTEATITRYRTAWQTDQELPPPNPQSLAKQNQESDRSYRAPRDNSPALTSTNGSEPTEAAQAPSEPIDPNTAETITVRPDLVVANPSDRDGLSWLAGKTEAQIRSISDPWGPAIRAQIQRWYLAFGFQGETGSAPLLPNPPTRGRPAGDLTRREVTPVPKSSGAKR